MKLTVQHSYLDPTLTTEVGHLDPPFLMDGQSAYESVSLRKGERSGRSGFGLMFFFSLLEKQKNSGWRSFSTPKNYIFHFWAAVMFEVVFWQTEMTVYGTLLCM